MVTRHMTSLVLALFLAPTASAQANSTKAAGDKRDAAEARTVAPGNPEEDKRNADRPPATVAIAPLVTDGTPLWVGDMISDSLVLRLLRRGGFNVTTVRQVRAAVRHGGASIPSGDNPDSAYALAAEVGADFIIVGHLRGQNPTGLTLVGLDAVHKQVISEHNVTASSYIGLETLAAKAMNAILNIDPHAEPGAYGTNHSTALRNAGQAMRMLRRQSLSPRAADPNAPTPITPEDQRLIKALAQEAIVSDRSFGMPHVAMALLLSISGDHRGAARALTMASKLGAGDVPEAISVAAFVQMRQGNFDAAQKVFEEAVEKYPGLLHVRGSLGHLHSHFGRFRPARSVFKAYAARVPRQPWVLAQVGYAESRMGRRDAAIVTTQKALELVPDSSYLQLELASRYIDAKNLEAAKGVLDNLLRGSPRSPRALVRLGYVQLLMGDDQGAAKTSAKALEVAAEPALRRERSYAHLNLARALGHAGDVDQAIVHLLKAKEAGMTTFAEVEFDPKLEALRQRKEWAQIN